jgi:hypothetical protein
LVASALSKQQPLFAFNNAEIGFLKFKESKLTVETYCMQSHVD